MSAGMGEWPFLSGSIWQEVNSSLELLTVNSPDAFLYNQQHDCSTAMQLFFPRIPLPNKHAPEISEEKMWCSGRHRLMLKTHRVVCEQPIWRSKLDSSKIREQTHAPSKNSQAQTLLACSARIGRHFS